MKYNLIIGGLAAMVPLCGLHAQEKTAPAEEMSMEDRKASVTNLETHIAQREVRLAEWGSDIVDLDARIEKRVNELVKMLAGLRDSDQSRTKVNQIKKDAIEGLKRGIDLYVAKRKDIREKVRTGEIAAAGDLGKFDKRIFTRIDQIAELTKSIPTHQDVDKYESDGGSYWNGYYQENSRISDDWKQNRRDTIQSDMLRSDTTKALKEVLERLDQRRRSLKDLMANRKLTDSAKTLYTSELGQIGAYEDHINSQLRDITTSTGGGGKAIGRNQAHDVGNIIDDARKDLREDVSRLFRAYDKFANGRSYLEGLKTNLQARKDWLEKNDK
jgi:hypothetical protein